MTDNLAAPQESLFDLLTSFNAAASIGSEDVLAAVLPLLMQAQQSHAEGRVAPLSSPDVLHADHGHLWYQNRAALAPRTSAEVLARRRADRVSGIRIIEELSVESDDVAGRSVTDVLVTDTLDGTPRYLTGYRSWEAEAGHHDPLTDIFSLGMLIGSLATGLDFRQVKALQTFVRHRADLTRLNNRLHPVICRVIERMTALERHDRAQDLGLLIATLENHRAIDPGLAEGVGPVRPGKGEPRADLLRRLRARLYDLTRRNRLVFHKPTASELNLTETSVPLVIDPKAIRADDLFTARSRPMNMLLAGKEVTLGEFLRFEEVLFAPSVLGRLRADADRDAREFGASQLRLVPVFLRWYDLKTEPRDQISSPLLLMRVTLKRRKGVRDAFTLALEGSVAEVNPALAFFLERLYGIALPATVDLADPEALPGLHRMLESQIKASEPGVSLDYADRPRMRLLHQKVRRRLDQFNRRQVAVTKGLKSRAGMTYSYERPGYNPLGVQLFHEFVRLAEAPNRELAGRPLPRMFNRMEMVAEPGVTEPAVTELSRTMLQHVEETRSRFEWAFDLCSVTLSNFNYRKMSLVRDYNDMLAGAESQTANFDLFFSSAPRLADEIPQVPPPESRFPVIAMDPSQDRAVLRARTGQSYVIQGPPGTGKSQTIANLIADYIGRGKRVLFVCEKRAALDVVFNRLKAVGLGSMCALVHDSQENKRDFIKELEQIYTGWADLPPRFTESQIDGQRRTALERIATITRDVRLLVRSMTGPAAGTTTVLHDVLEEALSHPPVAVAEDMRPLLPDLGDWLAVRDDVRRALDGLRRMTGTALLSARPERLIAPGLWASTDLRNDLMPVLDRLQPRLTALAGLSELAGRALGPALAEVALADRLAPLARAGRLAALVPLSTDARQLRDGLHAVQDLAQALAAAQGKTAVWTDKLSPAETDTALRLAQAKEGGLLAFLSGDWRQLKRVVLSRVRLGGLAIRPRITDLLADLQAEHQAQATWEQATRRLARDHGFEDFATLSTLITDLEAGLDASAQPILDAVRAGDPAAAQRIIALAALAPQTRDLLAEARGSLSSLDMLPVAEAPEAVATLSRSLPQLLDLQHLMAPLALAPDRVWDALRRLPLDPGQLDSAVLHETVRRSLVRAPGLATIDAGMLAEARASIAATRVELETLNARLLETRAIQRFRAGMVLTNTPDRDLAAPDRAQKAALAQARRALEHEFGKTRAYRSIRELLDGPAGAILPDLKPIWLMSPLSVADVLPLGRAIFDVVIFDEASQIPVEDAIPTLVRAPQVIVVGDEKQLPPTNFFGSSAADEDFDAEDEDPDFELAQDSFLSLAGERLSSVMLSWHYRSRAEELIGFSNAAFYRERLLTIPSTHRLLPAPPITVPDPTKLPLAAPDLRRRPVSFHHLPHGLYSARRNTQEAVYIARLLRDLLAEGSGKTFGIVAFSEAQQGEIETALAALAVEDTDFGRKLEQERDRTEDGEFIGLFVKNLENVQGDERDVIILSICYAPDHSGKMRMNFGPINKLGGERRLNVIFSRSKENMVIVSSITSDAITNDYNLGANTLKTFLRYAETLSVGDEEGARIALRRISSGAERAEGSALDVARSQIAARLRAAGLEVREGLGLSSFSVDLALRSAGAERHQTAVLLDSALRYRQGGLDEMLLARASLLERSGWRVVTVPLKDWWQDPDRIIATIIGAT
jgi:AAA domain/Protein of unknown function (DUF4011)